MSACSLSARDPLLPALCRPTQTATRPSVRRSGRAGPGDARGFDNTTLKHSGASLPPFGAVRNAGGAQAARRALPAPPPACSKPHGGARPAAAADGDGATAVGLGARHHAASGRRTRRCRGRTAASRAAAGRGAARPRGLVLPGGGRPGCARRKVRTPAQQEHGSASSFSAMGTALAVAWRAHPAIAARGAVARVQDQPAALLLLPRARAQAAASAHPASPPCPRPHPSAPGSGTSWRCACRTGASAAARCSRHTSRSPRHTAARHQATRRWSLRVGDARFEKRLRRWGWGWAGVGWGGGVGGTRLLCVDVRLRARAHALAGRQSRSRLGPRLGSCPALAPSQPN